jgi:transposase
MTWKVAGRCKKMLIHRVSMPAEQQIFIQYVRNKFPERTIHLIYEAGSRGFNLFDRLTEERMGCIVIPPHLVTEPKVNRAKTDKRDANRLAVMRAYWLPSALYGRQASPCCPCPVIRDGK